MENILMLVGETSLQALVDAAARNWSWTVGGAVVIVVLVGCSIRQTIQSCSRERTRREVTITLPGGDTRILEDHLVPNVAEDGRVSGFFLLGTDITEHKRTEEALREARDTLALRVSCWSTGD